MSRPAIAFTTALVAAQLCWGALYIYRTSFAVGDVRVFSLWDDAMISMRYARNLADGHGLVWNPNGEPVQGFTNLGVTLVMAALHLLPVRPAHMALLFQLLNLGCLTAVTLLVMRTARTLGTTPWLPVGAALSVAVATPFAIWALQGADTGLVALWLGVAVARLAVAEERGTGWPRGLFAWLALGLVLRLDFAIFYAVFLGAAATLPGAVKRLASGAAWGMAAVGAIVGFGLFYYHDPLPNTFYLKATGAPLKLVLGFGLAQLLAWRGGLVALGTAVPAVLAHRRSRVVWTAAGLVGVAVAYHVLVGGDWLPEYGSRHLIAPLPFLLLLSAVGIWTTAERLVPVAVFRSLPFQLVLVGLAALASLSNSSSTTLPEWLDPARPTMLHEINAEKAAIGYYLREHTLRTTQIAVHWAGIAPYFSERPAVDVLGRSDRHIARLEVDHFAPGHSKWDWDYVLDLKPDIFLIRTRGLGRRLDFVYDYERVDTSGGLFFYLRKGSRFRLTDAGVTFTDLVAARSGGS